MPVGDRYRPVPAHLELGDVFYDVVTPARFPAHLLRFRNRRWAGRVGLDTLTTAEWEAHFARFEPLPDNLPQPLALRYHGHQFRAYNPHLGDGRGFLFAQLRDGDGRLLDLATKGSGQTPWSRGGDGRLTLKGGVREVLATSMLEALGVPTSQSFSLFETGEALQRGDEPSPTRSSVLVRLGHSHVRFGTFQRVFHQGDVASTRRLVAFVLAHYLPEAAGGGDDPAVAMLRAVTARSARLAAAWMASGFVHGVLNTDNMNVTGESFDYGPYRFLPTFDPGFTAAYFDPGGLYAYGRQPATVQWNLERLADTLTPLVPQAQLAPALAAFAPTFRAAFHAAILTRLGIASAGPDEDAALVAAVLAFLRESQVGVDRFFFDWYGGTASTRRAARSPAASHWAGAAFAPVQRRLELHTPRHPERLAHAYFQGDAPCALLIDEIESLWSAIAERDDWTAFHAKLDTIETLRTLSDPLV